MTNDYGQVKTAARALTERPGEMRRLTSSLPLIARKLAGIALASSILIGSITPAFARAVNTAEEAAGASVAPTTQVVSNAVRPELDNNVIVFNPQFNQG